MTPWSTNGLLLAVCPQSSDRVRILGFPPKSTGEGASSLLGWGPKISLALEQPSLAPVQERAALREEIFSRYFRPSPRKTTCQGKKSIHHHRGTPPLLVCRPTQRSQNKNSYGVYHLLGKTRPGKKGIHHRGSRPPKKTRVSTVVVYTFFFPGPGT